MIPFRNSFFDLVALVSDLRLTNYLLASMSLSMSQSNPVDNFAPGLLLAYGGCFCMVGCGEVGYPFNTTLPLALDWTRRCRTD